ncbi:MAG: hypothetical protein MJZ66_02220 [Bacteroidales bacterium]|nr:hypothetical protein [Bacteroidales bacterium]
MDVSSLLCPHCGSADCKIVKTIASTYDCEAKVYYLCNSNRVEYCRSFDLKESRSASNSLLNKRMFCLAIDDLRRDYNSYFNAVKLYDLLLEFVGEKSGIIEGIYCGKFLSLYLLGDSYIKDNVDVSKGGECYKKALLLCEKILKMESCEKEEGLIEFFNICRSLLLYNMPKELSKFESKYDIRRWALYGSSEISLLEEMAKDHPFFADCCLQFPVVLEKTEESVWQDFDMYKKIDVNSSPEFIQQCNDLKFSTSKYIPFVDRQFIMFAKNSEAIKRYYDVDDNIKWFFTLDKYPSDIHIEGFPQTGVLYMANPVKPNVYIPAASADEMLFDDKIREFEYLMSCLGATRISFRSLKGRKIYSENSSSNNIGASVGLGTLGVNGSYSSSEFGNSDSVYSSEIGRDQEWNPTKYPYCPDDLYWFKYVDAWKTLVKQRLEGNQLSFRYVFKSSECVQLSNQRRQEISVSFNRLMLSANANYNQESSSVFKSQEETEWVVDVVFKPLEEFVSGKSSLTMTDSERTYLEEVRFILEDGPIGQRERNALIRMSNRLGISVERARGLEDSIVPKLSEEEQQYYDELCAILEDGVIGDRERKSLDRFKNRLGLSDARALEIEKMVKN